METLGPWGWFIIAGLLMIGELAAPGTYLIWLGIAAGVTGGIAFAIDLHWQMQAVLFAVLALLAVLAGRRVASRTEGATDQPFLNRRADALVGRSFVLDEPIHGGAGRVRIDDSVWRVEGEDRPAGSVVVVERIDGAILKVRGG